MDDFTPEDTAPEIQAETQPETQTEPMLPEVLEETGEEILSGEPVPDDEYDEDDLINESVEFINQTVAAMMVEAFIRIGEHLLTRYFNNDIAQAASRSKYKNTSFNRLCRRPDLSLTRQDLSMTVRVASQYRDLAKRGIDLSRLSYTHQRYLTMLPSGETKYNLISECIAENLPSRKLYVRIRGILKAAAEAASGQTPSERIASEYRKTLHRLTVATANAAVPDSLTQQEGLYLLDKQSLLQLKESAAQWASALEAKLEECAALIAQVEYTVAHPNY